jgi:hypothetical protein
VHDVLTCGIDTALPGVLLDDNTDDGIGLCICTQFDGFVSQLNGVWLGQACGECSDLQRTLWCSTSTTTKRTTTKRTTTKATTTTRTTPRRMFFSSTFYVSHATQPTVL